MFERTTEVCFWVRHGPVPSRDLELAAHFLEMRAVPV